MCMIGTLYDDLFYPKKKLDLSGDCIIYILYTICTVVRAYLDTVCWFVCIRVWGFWWAVFEVIPFWPQLPLGYSSRFRSLDLWKTMLWQVYRTKHPSGCDSRGSATKTCYESLKFIYFEKATKFCKIFT